MARELPRQEVDGRIPGQRLVHRFSRVHADAAAQVEMKVRVRAHAPDAILRHPCAQPLKLALLLRRRCLPVLPFAPVRYGVEIDADGKRMHFPAGVGAIAVLREPAGHVRMRQNRARAGEIRGNRPVLVAGHERKACFDVRQDAFDERGE